MIFIPIPNCIIDTTFSEGLNKFRQCLNFSKDKKKYKGQPCMDNLEWASVSQYERYLLEVGQ